jgi:hypothetical protein
MMTSRDAKPDVTEIGAGTMQPGYLGCCAGTLAVRCLSS